MPDSVKVSWGHREHYIGIIEKTMIV